MRVIYAALLILLGGCRTNKAATVKALDTPEEIAQAFASYSAVAGTNPFRAKVTALGAMTWGGLATDLTSKPHAASLAFAGESFTGMDAFFTKASQGYKDMGKSYPNVKAYWDSIGLKTEERVTADDFAQGLHLLKPLIQAVVGNTQLSLTKQDLVLMAKAGLVAQGADLHNSPTGLLALLETTDGTHYASELSAAALAGYQKIADRAQYYLDAITRFRAKAAQEGMVVSEQCEGAIERLGRSLGGFNQARDVANNQEQILIDANSNITDRDVEVMNAMCAK